MFWLLFCLIILTLQVSMIFVNKLIKPDTFLVPYLSSRLCPHWWASILCWVSVAVMENHITDILKNYCHLRSILFLCTFHSCCLHLVSISNLHFDFTFFNIKQSLQVICHVTGCSSITNPNIGAVVITVCFLLSRSLLIQRLQVLHLPSCLDASGVSFCWTSVTNQKLWAISLMKLKLK